MFDMFHRKHCRKNPSFMFGVVEEIVLKNKSTWPPARSGHRMCADENFLYVFGGYDPNEDHQLYNELWRFNITTEKWVRLPDNNNMAPLQCASSTMLLWHKKIVVFGGSGYPFAVTNSNKLYVYCLQTYQWLDLNKLGESEWFERRGEYPIRFKKDCSCKVIRCRNPPIPKYGHSMALCEKTGDLFIYSGTTGRTFTEELHRFSLKDLTWDAIEFCPKHKNDIPCGRYRHEVVWTEDEFFLFGGSTLDNTFGIDDVYSFNFKEMLWQKHSCKSNRKNTSVSGNDTFVYPCARKAHSCVLYNGLVYMVGGINGNQMFQDIWIFSLADKQWIYSQKLEFPRKIHFHASAVTTRGCMYVFGGIGTDHARKSDLHKMWLSVPSLKVQAWLKVVELLKRNKMLSKQVLIRLGIPKNFYFLLDDSCYPAG